MRREPYVGIQGSLWRYHLAAVLAVVWVPVWASAAVNLELRPASRAVAVGETFEVTLVASSDSDNDQTFLSVQAVIGWDPLRVEFVELRQLCPPAPCPDDTYGAWNPSAVGDFLPDDGVLVYFAFGPFLPEEPRPIATPSGLRIVALRFKATAPGRSAIQIVPNIARITTTVDGGGGVAVLGTIGPPTDVVAVACGTPQITVVGSRYLRIVPAEGSDPLALRVTGEPGNPDVECVSGFIQAFGGLGATPILRTPDEWNAIFLTGKEIIPGTSYAVRAECGLGDGADVVVSPIATATTWKWGDVNGDNVVDLGDVSLVFEAAQGSLPPTAILENFDLAPCVPDGIIDEQDVVRVQTALGGSAYPCFTPCEPGPNADVFGDFVGCLSGPDFTAPIGCVRYDANGDAKIDLADFAELQFDFGVR